MSHSRPSRPPGWSSRGTHPRNSAQKAFHAAAEQFLENSARRFPESASALGWEEFDPLLGSNDTASHRAHIKDIRSALTTIEALPESAFTGDDWLDRRAFLSMLRTALFENDHLARWQNNPQQHCNAAVESIFGLVVRNPANPLRALPALRSRLRKIPDFLDAGASCLRHPIPLWTALAAKSCQGAAEFLQGLQTDFLTHVPDPARFRSEISTASRAFLAYAESAARRSPGHKNGFAIGREGFDFLIRERLGLDSTLPALEADGRLLVDQLREECRQEARRLGHRSAREALESASKCWLPQQSLLASYRAATLALKSRLSEAGFASFPPGESLDVLPTPAFLRHQFPTAAYSAPPPFSKRQRGIFWVNDLSLGVTDEKARLAEVRQHFGLELTSAHEAYPGHHLQFAIQNRHSRPLRRLFAHSIFYEGWTMWCEKLMVESSVVDQPHARLQYLHDSLWRACRIIIDCALHSGRLTVSAASGLLVKEVGFTNARACGDVHWYTSAPTVPMSYLLGRLELEKLHSHLVLAKGWTLCQFHDSILSRGALPWSWLRSAVPAFQ